MQGQPPILWDRAEGFQVYDGHGNMWMDWSSGVLVTNAGHSDPDIVGALEEQIRGRLLHNYCFPHAGRAELVEYLVDIAPPGMDKAFLLTTGAETVECAIKLARTYGQRVGGRKKVGIVSFERDFHGRTMGAQQAGGIPALKEWIVNLDPDFHQVPFPDGFRTEDTRFESFLEALDAKRVGPDRVSGVMMETYQGGGASFAPPEYIQSLADWCRQNDILFIADEVQASFGRTGKRFGFEHYGVVPDIACLGKGISSSLPLSAVVGRADVMDLYGPGEMTSTHTGNPLCCAASVANLKRILEGDLVENAARMGEVLFPGLEGIASRHRDVIGAVHGKGLVAGLHMVHAGGKEPDGELAFRVVERCYQKGLLMFAPVGFGGATIKISPPLIITAEAVEEGVSVLEEALVESM
jgi:4-aminobutyrate aminotransferase/diaminobutyrate-pyruvate transaminase/4-aminobutyrate aminotransferase/(S)-3-amino-2-methylpropionate transaminase